MRPVGEKRTGQMLSLSPLTVLPCAPLEQIEAAGRAGYDAVGLRLLPVSPTDPQIMGDAGLRRGIRERILAFGLQVLDVEVVRIDPDSDLAALAPMLEYAALLGARQLTITSALRAAYLTQDVHRGVDWTHQLCELAAQYSIRPMIEFMVFRGIATFDDALSFVERVDHPNFGICLDALHFYRSGGSIGAFSHQQKRLISCFQICDGPLVPPTDLQYEARQARLYPGEGELPLADLIAWLPSDVPVSLEAPKSDSQAMSPSERAKIGFVCARNILTAARKQ